MIDLDYLWERVRASVEGVTRPYERDGVRIEATVYLTFMRQIVQKINSLDLGGRESSHLRAWLSRELDELAGEIERLQSRMPETGYTISDPRITDEFEDE